MIHPKTELQFISKEVGYGVVATEFIPAGTITWVLDHLDRTFKPTDVKKFDPLYQQILDTYCFRNNKGEWVLCWDNARFVNHSFNSNCMSTAYDYEIAIRDIQPGEQLTDDYGYLNISEPFRGIDEGTKRKTVYPDDLLKYHATWDKLLMNVFHLIPQQHQPLHSLIPTKTWDKTVKIAEGKTKMESILSCHFAEGTKEPLFMNGNGQSHKVKTG